jgi:hypothetical protein
VRYCGLAGLPAIYRRITAFEGGVTARQEVMSKLTGQLTEFHTKVGGDVSKISALFSDLTPEPQARSP